MKILSESSSTITINTYEIGYEDEKLVYIEYLNNKGKITDCELRDENGNSLQDNDGPDNNAAATLEKIQDFVDSI